MTTALSGRSISPRRRRIAAVRWQGRWEDRWHDGRILFRGSGEDLGGARCGVGREYDPNLRHERGIDPQIMPDHSGHEWRDIWALTRELHDRAHDDLRFLGRREPDEPAVRRPVRVLRGAGLPGDRDAAPEPSRASRRAALHHADHRLAQPGDRKSTRLNSSHMSISYAVFCLKKKKKTNI